MPAKFDARATGPFSPVVVRKRVVNLVSAWAMAIPNGSVARLGQVPWLGLGGLVASAGGRTG